MEFLVVLEVALGLAGVYFVYALLLKSPKRSSFPLPPGPKPLPIVGNLFDLPSGVEAEHWAKHAHLYGMFLWYLQSAPSLTVSRKLGPISSVSMFGQTIVIVNSLQTAFNLMEGKSSIYSSRPRSVFGVCIRFLRDDRGV